MMKSVPVKKIIQNIDTGEEIETDSSMQLMPPHPDACQICGNLPAHNPGEPHNAQSLYYQYSFYAENKRWPTWKDAIAHCSDIVKENWEHELRSRGLWSE